jgi:photosystem II stability/assembly factor-like uncharacterized protein
MPRPRRDLPLALGLALGPTLGLTLLAATHARAQRAPAAARAPLPQRPPGAPDPADTARLQGLRWRNVGPFRGGRAVAVAGHPGQPLTFYMGATGGGVWKTDDAGTTWRNVTDGQVAMGSVGAVAVAPSDPNVVYVGMGEGPVRGVSSSYGDGVYKSTDGGRTWAHLGLERTRTISRVVVHPKDDATLWVAAQGTRWGPSDDRGVYKSTDGGKSFRRVLAGANATSGPSELSIDPTNPRVLYAAFWDHQRLPWYARSGGPGSGLWKSTDGGETWARLTGGGLPGAMGKTSVAVSPANPERVWALIEGTADSGGLYRSDDGGKAWRLVNGDRLLRARAWYYIHLWPDPRSADVVYVMNAPLLKSTDGGRTFAAVGTPHGDNHALWVNPDDPRVMINANDGGANVSMNGGRTWSTQANQPTAQFYRATLDARFPFWIYGGQQDNTSVAVPSRTSGAGVTERDWFPAGGCESAYPGVDARDPKVLYGGCYQGLIDAFDLTTRESRPVMAYAELGLSVPSDKKKYRFNWTAPVVVSRHDPRVVYHAGNVLLRTADGGTSWAPVSPDLTRNDPKRLGAGGGPYTNEGAGGEVYGTIFDVAESPRDAAVLWVTTDDGLVQVTQDAGRTWRNVTPPGLGDGLAYAVDASAHAAGTAYVAFTRFKWDDNRPYVLKTADFGRTWTRLDAGLPAYPVRVVREDPRRPGLLYLGNETGVWYSADDGRRWRPLQRNLPRVPVTDLRVSADGDLVAATEGRAYWVLDDLSPLRQAGLALGAPPPARPLLLAPRPAVRYGLNAGGPAGLPPGAAIGQNPAGGATLDFWLPAAPDSARRARLEVVDAAGQVVRRYPTPADRLAPRAEGGGPAPRGFAPVAGHNRWTWDLRTEGARLVPALLYDGSTAGWVVPPGAYTVRLLVGADTLAQPLEVRDPPHAVAAASDGGRAAAHTERAAVNRRAAARVDEVTGAVLTLRQVREGVRALAARAQAPAEGGGDPAARSALATRAAAVAATLDTLERTLVSVDRRTFQDVVNFPPALLDHYLFVARQADDAEPTTRGIAARLADLDAEWGRRRSALDGVMGRDVAELNRWRRRRGCPPWSLPRGRRAWRGAEGAAGGA